MPGTVAFLGTVHKFAIVVKQAIPSVFQYNTNLEDFTKHFEKTHFRIPDIMYFCVGFLLKELYLFNYSKSKHLISAVFKMHILLLVLINNV